MSNGIYFGSTQAQKIFLGATEADSVYLSATKVWSKIVTTNFAYTGAAQSWTAPSDGMVTATLNGPGTYSSPTDGSKGGKTTITFAVKAGDVIQVNVGGTPIYTAGGATQNVAGWNGGGFGSYLTQDQVCHAGAGATDIRLGGTALTNRIAVAGGAGGPGSGTSGTSSYPGGVGGGNTGGVSTAGSSAYYGKGGTQTAGGAGGSGSSAGSLGTGASTSGGTYSGSGGGGYYGGGAGGGNQAGGGGSGYYATMVNGALATGSTTQGTGNLSHGDASLAFTAGATSPKIGDPYLGGYFAGIMDTTKANIISTDASQTGLKYALIVAPQSFAIASIQYATTDTAAPSAARTRWDGLTATAAMNSAGFPAAQRCASLSYPSDGASAWYLPAMDELELLYRNLKPTTEANNTTQMTGMQFPGTSQSQGYNPSSSPPGAAYTSSVPGQTSVALFKSGAAQALANTGDVKYYWSSTEWSDADGWSQSMSSASYSGYQSYDPKSYVETVLPVRRLVL